VDSPCEHRCAVDNMASSHPPRRPKRAQRLRACRPDLFRLSGGSLAESSSAGARQG
jgi:hypothetical protein